MIEKFMAEGLGSRWIRSDGPALPLDNVVVPVFSGSVGSAVSLQSECSLRTKRQASWEVPVSPGMEFHV